VLGVLEVLTRRPLADTRGARVLLRRFAGRAATELARQRAQNLRLLAEHIHDGILVYAGGRHVYVNARLAAMLGYEPEELIGTGLADLVHPSERARVEERFRRRVAGEAVPAQYETCLRARNGEAVPIEIAVSRTVWQGAPAWVVAARDIRERRRAEAETRKLSHALAHTADAVVITDRDGRIEYVNEAFEAVTGYAREAVLGRTPALLKSGKQGPEFYRKMWQMILAGSVFSEVFVNRRRDGTLYYEEKIITPLTDADGRITHFVATGRDISERVQIQERMQYLAHHDALTELPNRALFLDRLKQALARARWHQRLVAVLFLDIDHFKNINDSLGHDAGDRLLQELAKRLGGALRDGDTVARFGGDEFVILLDDVAAPGDVRALAHKLLAVLAAPFPAADAVLHVSASIGISLFPADGEDAATLLKHADTAMYRAKESGRNTSRFYSADMSARAFERLTLESALRHALAREELVLHYQPQVEIGSGRVLAVEALLRWQHPELGLVTPTEFVPVLEETGLIVAVGEWVLRSACAAAAAWHAGGHAGLRVAVNLSSRQFNDGGLVARVEAALAAAGLAPGQLELEITEGLLLHHGPATLEALAALRRLGVRVALDDFGTGYSSFTYLRRFPIDTLKIDRQFVLDLPDDANDAAITRAIVAMGQGMGLDLVAEGVETEAQRDFLAALGCTLMQGYLFSRPLPAAGVTALLAERNRPAAG
jgi:diguanylate cyclase (GGDEF)-like protein/PAS domain S-box-containing protein